jgi:hypothetical protein
MIVCQRDLQGVRARIEKVWRKLGIGMVQASGAREEQLEVVANVLASGSLRCVDPRGAGMLPYFTEKRTMRR